MKEEMTIHFDLFIKKMLRILKKPTSTRKPPTMKMKISTQS